MVTWIVTNDKKTVEIGSFWTGHIKRHFILMNKDSSNVDLEHIKLFIRVLYPSILKLLTTTIINKFEILDWFKSSFKTNYLFRCLKLIILPDWVFFSPVNLKSVIDSRRLCSWDTCLLILDRKLLTRTCGSRKLPGWAILWMSKKAYHCSNQVSIFYFKRALLLT